MVTTRRPGRAVMTALGVALGTAAIVTTITLVATIRFQVSDEFDIRRATQVDLRSRLDTSPSERSEEAIHFPPAPETMERIETMSGVVGVAAIRETFTDQPVILNQINDPLAKPVSIPLFGVDVRGLESLEALIDGPIWSQWHDEHAERIAVLSDRAAKAIGAPDLAVGDYIFINRLRFTVSGRLKNSPRVGGLAGGILLPLTTIELFDLNKDRDRIVVVTAAGAAEQVARALPVAMSPTSPEAWVAYAPGEDTTLRLAVDNQLQTLALGLGGAVLVLGIVSIGNSTLTSVMQRIHEIGLRRALGARPRHIASHILIDAATIGLIGGIAGTTLGLTATLAVTASQGWVPVIDPRVPATVIAIGVVSGVVAGLYPARVGSRLEPTEALRRE